MSICSRPIAAEFTFRKEGGRAEDCKRGGIRWISLATEISSEANLQLDIPVLLTALVTTTAAGLLFGCAPAWVSPDYYKTLGIEVVRGRTFSDLDTASSPRVAMVNEEFVRRYLKGLNPLQQRLSIEQIIPGLPQLGPAVEWQIVGVFHDVRYGDFRDPIAEVDVPFTQSLSKSVHVGVRTSGDPAAMSKTIAAAVHGVDSDVALAYVRTLDQVKEESLGEDRYTMVLFACFASVALLLAAVGIYALMAFAVSQRTSEIGLRLALGATRVNVIVLKEALLLALMGLGIGLAGSVFVGRAMRSTLYGVAALDYFVIVAVGLILLGTAVFASFWPARRAALTDPVAALHVELTRAVCPFLTFPAV